VIKMVRVDVFLDYLMEQVNTLERAIIVEGVFKKIEKP